MLHDSSSWVWDFWLADDGERYHLFFLHAPRSLDPELRHGRASVGHAVSPDLRTWERVPDALERGAAPAFDDVATWTGSVVRADGVWHMFYTGVTAPAGAYIQTIGLATSEDLFTWRKHEGNPLLAADPRWYEKYDGSGGWVDEAWRDPWVFADPAGDGWHKLVTARANHGDLDDRAVVGHARSRDLVQWEVQPPLSAPGGFGHLEVFQVERVEGRVVLLFNCLRNEFARSRLATDGGTGGVWAVTADALTGPFDIAAARQLTDDSLYVARLVQERDGRWVMLAFHNVGPDGTFVGGISDPMPVAMTAEGLTLVGPDG